MWLTLIASVYFINYKTISGRTSVYWPKDNYCGTRKANGKPFKSSDKHIAHRILPLGTAGLLCNKRTGDCIRTTVEDRGSWGAICEFKRGKPSTSRTRRHTFRAYSIIWEGRKYWWQTQLRLKSGCKRRTEFDVTKPIARLIEVKNFDYLIFIY